MEMNRAVRMLAERVSDISKEVNRTKLQRRNQVVDLFGIESTRQGDTSHPAEFYISVSPDLIYFERFEFKLIVQPFAIPVSGGGSIAPATVEVEETKLSGSGSSLSPNPHTHQTKPHIHGLTPGISLFDSVFDSDTIKIEMDGVDITKFLKEQHDSQKWIKGDGIYPEAGFVNYDILGIVERLEDWERGIVLKPGYKKLTFQADGIYNVTLVTYLKYSHVLR